jgi:murein DD-endopeptidase MepM/ murein hydrolase activator NlpD
MAGSAGRRGCWRAGAGLVAVGVAAGCTIYEPLGQGSHVPWAQAALARGNAASVDRAAAEPAVVALSGERHRVGRGDRLGDLAQTFGVSVADLARANNLKPPYIIRVGQVLQVPVPAQGAGPRPTMVAATTSRSHEVAAVPVAPRAPVTTTVAEAPPALRVAEAPPAPGKVAALETPPAAAALPSPKVKPAQVAAVAPGAGAADRYTVRPGETLSGIAHRHNVAMTDLARVNGIGEPYQVRAGQKLDIPGRGASGTTTVHLGADDGAVRLATGDPPPLAGDDFLWPVNGKVIGAFGPIDQWRRRDGIDIAARRGAPVLAAQDGIVAYAGEGIRGYGKMILLRHDQGYITTYAHNATLLVEVGAVVQRGQVIARVGDTGDATQSMLHFELRQGRTPIDPQTRLVSNTTAMASTTQ